MDDVQTQEDRDTLVAYVSAWKIQPYIDTDRIEFIQRIFDTESSPP